jgi:hypothetical protein
MRGFLLAGLGVMSVLGFGITGTASAGILFLPISEHFPYHMAGFTGKNTIEAKNQAFNIQSNHADVLVLVLSPTLADVHFRFLEVTTGGGNCSNVTGEAQTVLLNLLAHIGLVDPGRVPGFLGLIPAGFKFTCQSIIGSQHILVRGNIIGLITRPELNAASLLFGILLKTTTKGVQEHKTFLLGNETLTNQIEETSVNGGAFEESGLSGGVALVHALPGEGFFLLKLP